MSPQPVRVAQTVKNMEHIAKSFFIQIISFTEFRCGVVFHSVFLLFTHFPWLSTAFSTFYPFQKLYFTLFSTLSTELSTIEQMNPQSIQHRVENFSTPLWNEIRTILLFFSVKRKIDRGHFFAIYVWKTCLCTFPWYFVFYML